MKQRPEEPRCPMSGCGTLVGRPKCLFELPPTECPRHEVREAWQNKVRKYEAKTPVIFLDIDGVLVTYASIREEHEHAKAGRIATRYQKASTQMAPDCVARLSRLVEETEAEVVISSSWRIINTREFIAGAMVAAGFKYPERVISMTGRESHAGGQNYRHIEITAWLKRNNPRPSYVVFDDDWDAEIEGHFVHTSLETGLTDEHVEKAKEILGC